MQVTVKEFNKGQVLREGDGWPENSSMYIPVDEKIEIWLNDFFQDKKLIAMTTVATKRDPHSPLLVYTICWEPLETEQI